MVQIVKFSQGKKKFEIVTKDFAVRKYRAGKLGWDNVLAADQIFTNYKRGDIANVKDLTAVFGTDDITECLKIIVRDGDLCISASERKDDMDRYRREVIGYLHRTYVGANNLPHPLSRLEGIIAESKVRLDPSSNNVEKQADEVVKKMQGILVFKKSCTEFCITISHKYARKCQGIIYQHASNVNEKWDSTGCCYTCNIPNVEFDILVAGLNKLTQGDYQLLTGGQKVTQEEKETSKKKENEKRKQKKRNKRR